MTVSTVVPHFFGASQQSELTNLIMDYNDC
jgi:hypothetical protein